MLVTINMPSCCPKGMVYQMVDASQNNSFNYTVLVCVAV